jgi:plasmid replication initiation protein
MGLLDIFVRKNCQGKDSSLNSKSHRNTQGLIVKQNALIEGKYNLSVYELRIFNTLLSKIGQHDNKFNEYTISFKDLIKECRFSKGYASEKDHSLIKSTVKKLKSRVVEISDHKNEWAFYSLFEVARKEHGKDEVRFKISSELRPFLLELKGRFTKLDLHYLLLLTSTFAIRFYEISLEKMQDKKHCSYDITVADLRFRFELENKYKRFFDLKKNVLEKACAEINSKTNINLTYELISASTNKKQIHAIRFKVKRRDNNATITNNQQEELDLPAIQRPAIQHLKQLKIGKAERLYKQIGDAINSNKIQGYTNADKWFEDFFANWKETIQTQKTETGKPIENLGGYLKSLIDEQILATPKQEQQEEKRKEKEVREKEAERKSKRIIKIEEIIDQHIEENNHTYTAENFQSYIETINGISNKQHCSNTCKTITDVVNNYNKKTTQYAALRNFVFTNNLSLVEKIKQKLGK